MIPLRRVSAFLRTRDAAVTGILVLVLAGIAISGFPNRVDLALHDSTVPRIAPAPHDEVVIVAIDARALRELGRWPWSRSVLAVAVDRMKQVGVRAIAMDIALSERIKEDPEGDDALVAAVSRYGKVVLPVYPEIAQSPGTIGEAAPFAALRAVATLGHADVEIEEDGVSRGVYLRAGYGQARYPALALAVLETERGEQEALYTGARRPETSPKKLWTRDFANFVPFARTQGGFVRHSLFDVLTKRHVAVMLSGKYVVLGVTAEGLRTTFLTPGVGGAPLVSGVEYHANVLSALLHDRLIAQTSFPFHLVLAALCVFAPMSIYSRFSPGKAAWVAVGLGIAVLGIWLTSLLVGWWFAPSAALITLGVGYALWAWRRLLSTARALLREQKRARATLLSVGDGVLTADADWRVCYANPACQALIGQRIHHIRGKPIKEVLLFESTRDTRRFEDVLFYCAHARETVRPVDPFVLAQIESKRCAVRMCVSPILSGEPSEEHYVVAITDVTQSVEIARRVTYQATHDALTDLPNRLLLTDRIEQSIGAAQRSGEAVGVLFLDLDGFKRVNDALGHSHGDELLKEVAGRLVSRRRLSDTVARWGGDEFVILLRGLVRGESVAGAVADVQASLSIPFRLAEQDVHVSASIGVALYPQDGTDAETLLKHADSAMYLAKRAGRNQLRFYSEQDDLSGHRHLEIESHLHRALENDELVVFYQPQLSLHGDGVVGMEALVRWRHPEKGIVLPGQFMAVAEESSLVESIGERVMRLAFAQARSWENGEVGFRTLSVNVSPRQFMRPALIADLDRIIDASGVSPRQLKVEVTETLMVNDSADVRARFRAIKDRGLRLVLDDFGTGYSSLSYLKRFAPDEIKIDKSFIRNIAEHSQDAAITEAIINLAHRMNMTVVAEGVETLEQLNLLQQQNCDQVQGFFISPSVAAEAVPGVIRTIASRAMELNGRGTSGTPVH